MKKNLTELVFILDRSGSVGGLEKDTIGTEVIYEAVCETVCDFRASRPMSAEWKRRVDEDFKKRSR